MFCFYLLFYMYRKLFYLTLYFVFHQIHLIIKFDDIKPNIENLLIKKNELKKKINLIKTEVKMIQSQLD